MGNGTGTEAGLIGDVYKRQGLGYAYVALDLKGYRMGSMNEVLTKK